MVRMICRNKVKDFLVWKSVFEENLPAARDAGLELETLWRGLDDGDEVFFNFKVPDLDGARAFIADPAAADAGERSGVIDGNWWLVKDD